MQFEAIGTHWEIEFDSRVDRNRLAGLELKIRDRIDQFDRSYSRFRPDSLITMISQQAGEYVLPDDAPPLFDVYRRLYDLTGGRMTPLIGGLMVDTGYDATYSLTEKTLRPVPVWDEVMRYKAPVLTTQAEVMLDFGAAGKGYLCDIISELIMTTGITGSTVNAGGDILHQSLTGEQIKVALEHPEHPDEAIGVATFSNKSLCGSAGNRRAWGRFNHIMDPQRQASPTHLKAVWVVADNALTADALTTALYFARPQQLLDHFQFEYAMIGEDLSLEHSPHFPAQFFT